MGGWGCGCRRGRRGGRGRRRRLWGGRGCEHTGVDARAFVRLSVCLCVRVCACVRPSDSKEILHSFIFSSSIFLRKQGGEAPMQTPLLTKLVCRW